MTKLEQEILEYLQERGWDKHKPSDLVKSISIEAAELLEIFQWKSMTMDEVKNDPETILQIKDELPDILIYCLELAALLDIDSDELVRAKLEKVKSKYPAELFKDKEGKGRETYWKIKREHRANKFSE